MPARRGASPIRWIIYVLVALLFVSGGVAVVRLMRPAVTVTRLVEGPVIRAVYATGTVSPEREFPIRATNEGTLDEVLVDKGSAVRANGPLARIVDPALVYAVDQAQAQLNERRARAEPTASPVLAEFDARIRASSEQLEIAQREEQRLRDAFEAGGGSRSDVDRAADRTQTVWAALETARSQRQAKLLELQRDVDFAAAELKTAQWKLEQQELVSPIDGVVLDRPKSKGTRVAINEIIMRLADVRPSRLVMRAAVDEEDITRVHIGQSVIMTLYAFEGTKFDGKVRTIYAEADPNRRTFEVDIEILKPSDRLQPGMTGELAFVVEAREKATIVPSQAVQGGNVYVVRDGRVTRLQPKIGVSAVDRTEILGGIEPEDRVIISAVDPAIVGKSVKVSEVDPRAAAGLNRKDDDQPFNPMR